MKAVLRIALGFFSALPLQRWLNIIGGALMAIGTVIALTDWSSVNARKSAGFPLLLGAVFIALTPGVFGGALLRHASTRVLLQLRPHGRQKLLLGATLAMTMVAMLITLAMLPVVPEGRIAWSALDVFATAWSVVALVWIVVFVGSASPMWIALIWLAAYPIGQLRGRGLTIAVAGAPVLMLAALAWAIFCHWYMTVRSISHAPWLKRPQSPQTESPGPVARLLSRSFQKDQDVTALSSTRLYLIGKSSLADYATGILTPLLFAMVAGFALRRKHPDVAVIPPVVLPMLTMICATTAITITGRARLLWLRAGADRMGLFALAERHGLPAAMAALAAGAGACLVISLAAEPAYALPLFLFALSQLAFGACMFYGGLALTRGWELTEALPGLGLLLVIEVAVTARATVFPPSSDATTTVAGAALLLFMLLAPLLRWHARRRWRALDWRVVRLSMGGVTAMRDTHHAP